MSDVKIHKLLHRIATSKILYQLLLPFVLFTFLTLVYFYDSLTYYFFQDDWFIINYVRNKNIFELFRFNTDVIYYRPVGILLFFKFHYLMFNLNPVFFHLTIFTLHAINGFLIFRLLKLLKIKHFSSLLCAILYIGASFHFMSMGWLSLSWVSVGALFFLACLYNLIRFARNQSNITLGLVILLYILALFSTEFAVTIYAHVISISILFLNVKIKKMSKALLCMLAVTSIYAFLRFILFKPPIAGDYELTLNLSVIKNTLWYTVWLLNLPEIFKSHISVAEAIVSKDLAVEMKPFIKWLSLSMIIFLVTSATIFLNKSLSIFKIMITLALFIASLAPVIFFDAHTYPYYLTTPSVIIFIYLASIFDKVAKEGVFKKTLLVLFATSWLSVSFLTVQFQKKTHWIPGEQKISRNTIDSVKKNRAESSSSPIYLPNNTQLKQSLMDQEAMRLIFGDNNIQTIYMDSKK